MNTVTLDKLPMNSCGKVVSINSIGPIHRRLLDLGMVPSTSIQAVLQSPFGDPRAYLIRGSTIALREEDAKHIICEF